MSLTEQVAEEVRALMARRKISGARIARELGVSDAWISYRLSGKQPFDLNDIERIAAILEVDAIDLVASAGAVATARSSRNTLRYRKAAGRRAVTRTSRRKRRTDPERRVHRFSPMLMHREQAA